MSRAVLVCCVVLFSGWTLGCSGAGHPTRATMAARFAVDAERAWHAGRYDLAARRYERAVHQARAEDDQALVGVLLLRQAAALLAAKRPDLALPRALEAASSARLRGAKDHEARLMEGQSRALLGDVSGAQRALAHATQGDGCVALAALSGLGALHAKQNELDQALRRYTQAERLSCDSASVKAQYAFNLGRLYQRRQSLPQALAHFREATSLFRAARDELGLADSLRGLASAEAQRGRKAQAADAYRRCGHTAWAASRPKLAALCFGRAAQLLVQLKRPAEAEAAARHGRAAMAASEASPTNPRQAPRGPTP